MKMKSSPNSRECVRGKKIGLRSSVKRIGSQFLGVCWGVGWGLVGSRKRREPTYEHYMYEAYDANNKVAYEPSHRGGDMFNFFL